MHLPESLYRRSSQLCLNQGRVGSEPTPAPAEDGTTDSSAASGIRQPMPMELSFRAHVESVCWPQP